MRSAEITRNTNETKISLDLNLDGAGVYNVDSLVPFLDHMLELFARHGSFDLKLVCRGDIDVDDHHSVEDIAICLGNALNEALGDKRGILRYAHIILPMDESLLLVAMDVSGRAHLSYDVEFPTEKIGNFDTELVEEFFSAFVRHAGVTLHIKKLSGTNSHHIAEAIFKAFARVLASAVSINRDDPDSVPSTKGVIE